MAKSKTAGRRYDRKEVVDLLCAELANGGTMLGFCADVDMPDRDTIMRWAEADETIAANIARARELGQDHEMELCIKMADEATPEDWQVQKLRIWARQWRASKIAPRKYGDKLTQEIGGIGGGKLEFIVTRAGKQ